MSVLSLGEALASAQVFTDGDWVESRDQDPNGEVRLVQLADIGVGRFLDRSSRFLTHSKAAQLKCTFLEPGDVLVARMPDPLGRACIFPGSSQRCVTVVDVCIVRPDPERIDARYLMHMFNGPQMQRQILNFATGSTRSRISRGNLAKTQLSLPTLDEQRRIAAILDQADALRAKHRQVLAHLDSLTQSIFIDMFGDPETWPMRWDMGVIGDITESVQYGTSAKAGNSGAWPILRMGNVTDNGRLDPTDLKYIDLPESDIPKYTVRRGDLLFNRTNSIEKVGKSCVVETDRPLAFAGYLVRVRFKREHRPEFVCAYLTSRHGMAVRKRMAKAAVNQANINATEMRGIAIAQPPTELQEAFVRRVAAARAAVSVARTDSLDELFASLQARAFQGEL